MGKWIMPVMLMLAGIALANEYIGWLLAAIGVGWFITLAQCARVRNRRCPHVRG